MDAFDFGNVKAEKAYAMRRYNLLSNIAKTFRVLELCVALILLSWIVTRLPLAVKTSGDYIRKLVGFIGSPLFVFMISNAIIATLVAKSRQNTGQDSHNHNATTELYEEFLKNCADRSKSPSEPDALSRTAEEVEYEDKRVISEPSTTARMLQDQAEMDTCADVDAGAELDSNFPKIYRRTQSEKLEQEYNNMVRRKLQRSETENYRETARSGENPGENLYPHDNLSNEEFQHKIEAFIAKQMRFLREESSAIVVQNQS